MEAKAMTGMEMQPGNLFPEWGPWCPVIRLLPQAARDAFLEYVEAGSVCAGAAEIANGWWNIGGIIGTQRVPSLQRIAHEQRLPVYYPTPGHYFTDRIKVKSPLSQLVQWMQVNNPTRLLSLGVGQLPW